VSYLTFSIIIILMEAIKDLYQIPICCPGTIASSIAA
jgi:hypothetical protein